LYKESKIEIKTCKNVNGIIAISNNKDFFIYTIHEDKGNLQIIQIEDNEIKSKSKIYVQDTEIQYISISNDSSFLATVSNDVIN
jgi:hypothetical protein